MGLMKCSYPDKQLTFFHVPCIKIVGKALKNQKINQLNISYFLSKFTLSRLNRWFFEQIDPHLN